MNAPGQAGQDTGSQRKIGSGHTERKKTRDCRANRGEADRLSFPPSASPVRFPVTPPEQPMTCFVIIFVELFWQLLFAFFLLAVSACSLLTTFPSSESAVRCNGKGNELGKGERGKKKGVQKPMSLFNQGARYTYIESGIESEFVAAGGCKGMHIVHYSERRGEDG